MGGCCRLVEVPEGSSRTRIKRVYDGMVERVPAAARLARTALAPLASSSLPIPTSDGFVESLEVDLIHFTVPQAFLTELPSIYQPHDLLHRHYPEQFGRLHATYRERTYRAFCERANIVVVMTEWGRADLLAAYDLAPDRVAVVPWAPVAGLTSGDDVALAELPERFLLYPAQTWPHKNHVGLLDAIAELRRRGTIVPLVATGRQTEHMAEIRRRMTQLGLDDQVRFLGYVDDADLSSLYRQATALVFPSLFEGWGLPVVEAFAVGLPVLCSRSTALTEVAGDAALMFDPEDPNSIADAIARVWADDRLRAELRQRGQLRAAGLSWERTARVIRALHRKVTGRSLDEDDLELLAPPTLPA
jgi:glycosyltransferase involved in cell wall biosynthesis